MSVVQLPNGDYRLIERATPARFDVYGARRNARHQHWHEHNTYGSLSIWSGGQYVAASSWRSDDVAELWRTQPALRTVVTFLARNIAQVPLHVYEWRSETDRVRDRTHPLTRSLMEPNEFQSQFTFMEWIVSDLCLYPYSVIVKLQLDDDDDRVHLLPLPPEQCDLVFDQAGRLLSVEWAGHTIPADACVLLRWYSADRLWQDSPIEAIRALLDEDRRATEYRSSLWDNGAKISGVIERPIEAPLWSDPARERFRQSWQTHWGGAAWGAGRTQLPATAGGTPILEEGMKYQSVDTTSPEQAQWLEGRRLTTAQTGALYHVPPVFLGLLDQSSFANVTALHEVLYTDVLGPWMGFLEAELYRQLHGDFTDADALTLHFEIREKLEGNFITQADSLSTAVGGPWMTRAEARARMELPELEGEDAGGLIVPLNVLVGGQASPRDSVPDSRSMPSSGRKHFDAWKRRMTQAHKAIAGTPTTDESALIESLSGRLSDVVERMAAATYEALGVDPEDAAKAVVEPRVAALFGREDFESEVRTLIAAAGMAAVWIGALNVLDAVESADELLSDEGFEGFIESKTDDVATTFITAASEDVSEALADDGWPKALAAVFAHYRTVVAPRLGREVVQDSANLGRSDAARVSGLTTKTWRTTSSDPRPTHGALNGETVGIAERFSNGARWPGDGSLSVGERAGCECIVTFQNGDL